MHSITSLLLLLISARLIGRLFKAMGFQEILGGIVGGLLLNLSGLVSTNQELGGIMDLAVFLLIFAAGLEMNLQDIFSALRKKALICAVTSFSLSFGTGLGVSIFLDFNILQSLVVGLCFAITALPVVIGFLQNLNVMDTKMGHLIMGSTVLIDIAALLFLGIASNMESTKTIGEFIQVFFIKTFKMAAFFLIVMLVNNFLRAEISRAQQTEKLFKKLISYLGTEAIFGVGVAFVLVFSTLSETLGFHFIIGSFFGGLLLNKDIIGTNAFHSMNNTLDAVTRHFLTPIFFAYIGLHMSLDAFNKWEMLSLITFLAFASKILGAWLGGRLSAFNNQDALKIGIILNSRGVLDLIVANLAYSKGYIDSNIFSILIFLGVSSALLNPVLYRRFIFPPGPK